MLYLFNILLLLSLSAFAGDEVQLQKQIDSAFKNNSRYVALVPGKRYVLDSGVFIPAFRVRNGYMPMFIIDGFGNTIHCKKGFAINRLVKNQTEAAIEVPSRVIISRIMFIGNAVRLQATYNSVIRECSVEGADTAMDMQFCLNPSIMQITFQRSKSADIVLREGNWPGANGNNSQSNNAILTQNHHSAGLAQPVCIAVYNSSNVEINNGIFEGFNPQHNITYNALKSTTAKTFYVNRPHIENAPTKASIYLAPAGGIINLDGIWTQKHHVLVDATGAYGNAALTISNLPYLPNFKGVFRSKLTGISWKIEGAPYLVPKLDQSVFIKDSLFVPPFYNSLKAK